MLLKKVNYFMKVYSVCEVKRFNNFIMSITLKIISKKYVYRYFSHFPSCIAVHIIFSHAAYIQNRNTHCEETSIISIKKINK